METRDDVRADDPEGGEDGGGGGGAGGADGAVEDGRGFAWP